MKQVTTYIGIKIFKLLEEVPGSSLRELKNGTMKECKPKFDRHYCFQGSYKYDSVKECREAIDRIKKASPADISDEEFAKIMNEEIE